MIEIKTARYITCDDVEKLTGKHWGDFEFAQMAENDAYQVRFTTKGKVLTIFLWCLMVP